jgi:MFS family permease
MRPPLNRLFFASLYFVQGAILAYVSNFQKPYLAESGVSISQIALLTSAMIFPFVVKIFFGILSDRHSLFRWGYRKPYMLLGLGIGAACFFILASTNPHENFPLFFTLMVSATFGMALFDTSTDGFSIDLNRANIMRNPNHEDESGPIQSAMMTGKSVGYIVLSFAFGWAAKDFGFSAIFLTLGAISLAVFAWVFVFAQEVEGAEAEEIGFKLFFRELGWPTLIFAAYAIGYSVFSFGVDGLITLFLHQDLKIDASQIGSYGSARGCGAIFGALSAGWFVPKFGKRIASVGALIFLSAAMIALTGLTSNPANFLALGALWGAAWAFQETVFVILAMRLSERSLAATAFAFLMVFSNLGTAIGEGLATSLSGTFGFNAVFVSFAAANLAVIPILLIFHRNSLLDAPHMDERGR